MSDPRVTEAGCAEATLAPTGALGGEVPAAAVGEGQEGVGQASQENRGTEALPDGGHLAVRLAPGVQEAGLALLARLHLAGVGDIELAACSVRVEEAAAGEAFQGALGQLGKLLCLLLW